MHPECQSAVARRLSRAAGRREASHRVTVWIRNFGGCSSLNVLLLQRHSIYTEYIFGKGLFQISIYFLSYRGMLPNNQFIVGELLRGKYIRYTYTMVEHSNPSPLSTQVFCCLMSPSQSKTQPGSRTRKPNYEAATKSRLGLGVGSDPARVTSSQLLIPNFQCRGTSTSGAHPQPQSQC